MPQTTHATKSRLLKQIEEHHVLLQLCMRRAAATAVLTELPGVVQHLPHHQRQREAVPPVLRKEALPCLQHSLRHRFQTAEKLLTALRALST